MCEADNIAAGAPRPTHLGGDRRGTGVPHGNGPNPNGKEVAPGISCKLLATDTEKHRVSMLVRLSPGADIRPYAMSKSRSCISLMASYGSTTGSSIPETTTGRTRHWRQARVERDRLHRSRYKH